MTYSLLLLGGNYLCQPPLNSGHSSFPRNRLREGRGRVQGHTGVWTRAAVVLPPSRLAQEPRIPWQGGSSTSHVAQGPGDPTSSPITQSGRHAVPSQRSAPSARAKQDLSLSVAPAPTQEFNPSQPPFRV